MLERSILTRWRAQLLFHKPAYVSHVVTTHLQG